MSNNGRRIYIMGHPEYDKYSLFEEYKRDLAKGLKTRIPCNYFEQGDVNEKPVFTWKAHANILYTNWLNYYVYQRAPYCI